MAWRPPLTLEEWCRLWIVPGRLDVLYHMKRELQTGERELALVPFLANRARISVDAGANKGIWTEMMRRYSAHVHAFEPNPKLFRFLRRGVGRGVSCHALALSDATGLAELKVPCGSKGYSNQGASLSAVKIGNGNFRFLEVATTRLDDLDLGDVGFIKIDVEGHEMAVIDGASETLRRYRPPLIVEIEGKAHANPDRRTYRPNPIARL
jgi:FkbM family methyltransferase